MPDDPRGHWEYAGYVDGEQTFRRRSQTDVIHDDLAAILRALGIGDHARTYSPHDVVHRDILPAIKRLHPTASGDETPTPAGLDGYTAAQAEQLLSFIEVKMPGTLTAAEQTLRKHGMWPEEDNRD